MERVRAGSVVADSCNLAFGLGREMNNVKTSIQAVVGVCLKLSWIMLACLQSRAWHLTILDPYRSKRSKQHGAIKGPVFLDH